MRKAIVLLGIVLAAFSAQAQISVKPGLRAGLNFSKFTNSDTNLKTDFFVGGSIAIKLNKLYTLQPEVTYSRQGAKLNFYPVYIDQTFDPAINTNYHQQTLQLDYLSVAVINKFTFGKGFQALVGPSFDFKIADNFWKNSYDTPIGFDLALVAGIGYTFSKGLTIDARIKQGLIDVFGYDYTEYNYYDDNGNYYSDGGIEEAVLNQVFQFGVSYSFDIK